MVSRVGYFEGTDPILLTRLAAEGVETLPVANMSDHHGKYVNHLCKGEVDVVVGYLHKVIPAEPVRTALLSIMVDDMFSACKIHDIPVLLIVPSNLRNKAKKIVGNTEANIQFVAPEELEAQIRRYL
jgi:hypothetical protein